MTIPTSQIRKPEVQRIHMNYSVTHLGSTSTWFESSVLPFIAECMFQWNTLSVLPFLALELIKIPYP